MICNTQLAILLIHLTFAVHTGLNIQNSLDITPKKGIKSVYGNKKEHFEYISIFSHLNQFLIICVVWHEDLRYYRYRIQLCLELKPTLNERTARLQTAMSRTPRNKIMVQLMKSFRSTGCVFTYIHRTCLAIFTGLLLLQGSISSASHIDCLITMSIGPRERSWH